MKDFILAVGQWPVVPEKETNLARAEAFLRSAAREGASLCLLPEMFQAPYELPLIEASAEEEDGPTLTRIRGLARELALHVVAGSFCERRGASLHNSSFVVGPRGETLGVHRKIHLFDASLSTVALRESSVLTGGEMPLVVETPLCRLGVAICYDARFPAVFRYFEEQGVDVVVLPAAFSQETGGAHWHVLMCSRAVDYQVYLAAACPAPNRTSKYVAYGHSIIVDPWGEILAEAGESEAAIFAEVSAARLAEVRERLPLLRHRRKDLYRRWFKQGE